MNVLSLFDGISCARVALDRVGIPVDRYFASEIDEYAMKISKLRNPDTFHLGSVTDIFGDDKQEVPQYIFVNRDGVLTSHFTGGIDLLIGGSPCQDLSIAKRDRKGLGGVRSGLFYEYVRILKQVKPKYFILENVNSMPKEARDTISKELGVEPIMINASLVSAQQRKRLFWTNIPGVKLPEDKGIYLKDIIEDGYIEKDKSLALTATYSYGCARDYFLKSSRQLIFNQPVRIGNLNSGGQGDRIYHSDGKSVTLSANGGGRGAKTGLYIIQKHRGKNKGDIKLNKKPTLTSSSWEFNNKLFRDGVVRKLSPTECERLQGLPDSYTEGLSNTQRYKTLGNAFNVDVISHILSFIK